MVKTSAAWPPYLPSHHDHIHALGVIAATFNLLEHRLLGLFLLYLGFNDAIATIFQKVRDNSTRVDWLKRAVDINGETIEIKEAVHYFCAGFNRCAESRNILMHSSITNVVESGEISLSVFTKAKKGDLDWNRYFLNTELLRAVADGNHAFSRYGNNIMRYVSATYRSDELTGPFPTPNASSLPERPALPNSLIPQFLPIPTTQQSPP